MNGWSCRRFNLFPIGVRDCMHSKRDAGTLFHFDNVFGMDELRFGGINLYQIGELWAECGYQVAPHLQYCMELSYIVSGSGYFYIDGQQIEVGEGDIFYNAVGHVHAIATSPSSTLRFVYMGFSFNEEADARFADIRAFLQSKPYFHAREAHALMTPFFRNIDEFFMQKPHSSILIRNYLEEIIVLSCRAFASATLSPTTYLPHKSSHSVGYTVYSVMRYVDNHLLQLGSIQSIAADLGYSYSYLSHAFKNKTGMTLQRYINHKKAEKALEMMNRGGMSITEIAVQLNYETVQSFSKAFTRVMGHPPSRYIYQLHRTLQQEEP